MSVLILYGFLLTAVFGKFFVSMIQKMYIDNKIVYFTTILVSAMFFFVIFLSTLTIITIVTSNGHIVVKSSNLVTM